MHTRTNTQTHAHIEITTITVGLILFLGLICPLMLIVWPTPDYMRSTHVHTPIYSSPNTLSLTHTHTYGPITAITVGLILFLGLICPLMIIVWPIYAYIFVPHYLKVSPTNHADYQKNLIGTYVCVCEREIECLAMSLWVYPNV